jgi:hypothetical protein
MKPKSTFILSFGSLGQELFQKKLAISCQKRQQFLSTIFHQFLDELTQINNLSI